MVVVFLVTLLLGACIISWLGDIGGKGCMGMYIVSAVLASPVLLTTVLAVGTEPIPVSGPFERVGVDMPLMERGNQYVIVFMDYLTKWVGAYATEDQTSETIARLLVYNIVCRHGVPTELLSDRGQNLLSGLMQEVCTCLACTR